MSDGSTPTMPKPRGAPSGLSALLLDGLLADARISAAPPSTMPLALPAVTLPSFENAAGSFARPSSVVSGRR